MSSSFGAGLRVDFRFKSFRGSATCKSKHKKGWRYSCLTDTAVVIVRALPPQPAAFAPPALSAAAIRCHLLPELACLGPRTGDMHRHEPSRSITSPEESHFPHRLTFTHLVCQISVLRMLLRSYRVRSSGHDCKLPC